MDLTVFYHRDFLLHDPSPYDHPEAPERLHSALRGLESSGASYTVMEPCRGDPRLYAEVHDQGYVEWVLSLEPGEEPVWLDPDTYYSRGTRRSIERLACAATMALEVLEDSGPAAIIGRPPGHHAGRSGPALGAPTLGFCIFNTSALLARLLARRGRVAVFDFDAHHGNGTQEILWDEPTLHVGIHQDPATIYPGTGYPEDTGRAGGKANILLPPGARDDVGLKALELASQLLSDYDPDYLVVSAGFDGMEGDNLMVSLRLGPHFYYEAGRIARGAGRVVVMLEGGYGRGLVEGLSWFTRGLLGLSPPEGASRRSPEGVWERYRVLEARLLRALGRG